MKHGSGHKDTHKIGRLLLEESVITPEQLSVALKRQGQCGERIGSVLLQLGYLNTATLLEFLHKHSGTPSIDLFRGDIDMTVLDILTFEQMKQLQVLPLSLSNKGIYVAMADPDDFKAIDDLTFITGKTIIPVIVPHAQLSATFRYIEQHGGHISGPLSGKDIVVEQSKKAIQGTI